LTDYELEAATARVHKRHLELFANPSLNLEREDHIEKELKSRDIRRTNARSCRNLGRLIKGTVKPNSIKKSFLISLETPGGDELWRHIEGKRAVEEHLI
jgi:hypothetical protein